MSTSDTLLKKHLQESIISYEEFYAREKMHFVLSEADDNCFVYNDVLDVLNAYLTLNIQEVNKAAKRMAQYNLENNRPYIIAINSLNSLKHKILNVLLKDPSTKMASRFYAMANTAESTIAQSYLNNELQNFTKLNKLRLQSISRLNDTNTLYLYGAHLKWFDQLTLALKQMDMSKMPELNHQKCFLGKWILSEGEEVMLDKETFTEFVNLHENLHLIAKQIRLLFTELPIDFHILMLLLNKAELFSLAIGVELSLINNIRFQATASKDSLTGMLNRQPLYHIFSTQFELSHAIEKSFSLIMIDLDNFKQINDKNGHAEGDRVLQSFSKMVLSNLRESDFAIRYGGEEFLLVIPSMHLDTALILAEKLRKQCHTLKEKDALLQNISASFGVIEIYAETGERPSEALMQAYIQKVDKHLYCAKARGKDQVFSVHSTLQ